MAPWRQGTNNSRQGMLHFLDCLCNCSNGSNQRGRRPRMPRAAFGTTGVMGVSCACSRRFCPVGLWRERFVY